MCSILPGRAGGRKSLSDRSFALQHRVQAPWARPGENEIDKDEAKERREFAVVQDRIESFRCTHQEIGDCCKARKNESDRPREQADSKKRAPNQFDEPTHSDERIDLDVGKTRNGGKAENFCR